VEWCACFVSWCADQCGYIDAGIIPKFSLCTDGIAWFKQQGQWPDANYTPIPGDIIFFDWGADGSCDHVGIVESVENGVVNTIEGNSGDSCARRNYPLGEARLWDMVSQLIDHKRDRYMPVSVSIHIVLFSDG